MDEGEADSLLIRTPLGISGVATTQWNSLLENIVRDGLRLKIMVVGESGLGKSTCLRTLFGTDQVTTQAAPNEVKNEGVINHKTVRIEEKNVTLREGAFSLDLTIVDTPGYGDMVNNEDAWKPIISYIKRQLREYMDADNDPCRRARAIFDGRVHACLYFIASHRLKEVDVEFMRRLAPFVNVIPIIAKADTMTTRELAEFKATIRTELSNRGVLTFSPRITPQLVLELEVGGGSSRHQLAMSADAAEGGAGHKHDNQMRNIVPQPPYAVIGSTEVVRIPSLINDQRDSRVLGRQYPWGVCEVENASHCDMQALRSLLVRTHMGALVESTNDIYSHYRRTTMLEAAATVRRGRTAFALLAICGVVVVVLVISMLQSPVIGSAILSMWILAAFVWLVAFQMSESVRRISQPYLSAGLFRFLSSTTCCRTQQTQATASTACPACTMEYTSNEAFCTMCGFKRPR